ncbi:MAG: hypothetical protein ACTSVU_05575 [Promethearchaeota archaeon]
MNNKKIIVNLTVLLQLGLLFSTAIISNNTSSSHLQIEKEIQNNVKVNSPKPNSAGDFISLWDTTKTCGGSSNADQIKLPLSYLGTYDFNVNWGDGNNDMITEYDQAEVTHTYSNQGLFRDS